MFELEGGAKRYGAVVLFADLHLALNNGEIVSILGPSGCGKTTLLRTMCGLETLDKGARRLNGASLVNGEVHHAITMLFQQPVLYPHLSVAQNIGLGAPRATKKQERQFLASEVLGTLGMPGFEERSIAQLSGGEAQRVAFGRALLQRPDVLLLDEPFASVDVKRRLELAEMTRKHLKERNITAVHVTHDEDEAAVLSDRIIHWKDLASSSQEASEHGEERLARD
ncbi:hypothetical protein CMO85_04575 [Candidatus Woesearchaeota archaeon]|nr:hypothetical protein [Candidatus Woesearchaeota archaeon]